MQGWAKARPSFKALRQGIRLAGAVVIHLVFAGVLAIFVARPVHLDCSAAGCQMSIHFFTDITGSGGDAETRSAQRVAVSEGAADSTNVRCMSRCIIEAGASDAMLRASGGATFTDGADSAGDRRREQGMSASPGCGIGAVGSSGAATRLHRKGYIGAGRENA